MRAGLYRRRRVSPEFGLASPPPQEPHATLGKGVLVGGGAPDPPRPHTTQDSSRFQTPNKGTEVTQRAPAGSRSLVPGGGREDREPSVSGSVSGLPPGAPARWTGNGWESWGRFPAWSIRYRFSRRLGPDCGHPRALSSTQDYFAHCTPMILFLFCLSKWRLHIAPSCLFFYNGLSIQAQRLKKNTQLKHHQGQ